MARNMLDDLETQELLDILIEAGYGDMINTLLVSEKEMYTKKGRLNKCGACRVLDFKAKQFEDAFKHCREILGEDAL